MEGRGPPPVRQIVIPGELLSEHGLKPGSGTYADGGQVYAAQMGMRSERDGLVHVIPFGGKYIPRPQDVVIGKVTDFGASHWLLDINAPYPAPLHATESPWRVEFGDTERYLKVGDAVLCEVQTVDERMRVQVSMMDRQFRRLEGGQLIEISHAKVPRLIGREGTMIMMIRDFTRTHLIVGQNGRIWLDGEPDDVGNAIRAIRMIEGLAPTSGLTDAVREYLEGVYGKRAEGPAESEDDGGY